MTRKEWDQQHRAEIDKHREQLRIELLSERFLTDQNMYHEAFWHFLQWIYIALSVIVLSIPLEPEYGMWLRAAGYIGTVLTGGMLMVHRLRYRWVQKELAKVRPVSVGCHAPLEYRRWLREWSRGLPIVAAVTLGWTLLTGMADIRSSVLCVVGLGVSLYLRRVLRQLKPGVTDV